MTWSRWGLRYRKARSRGGRFGPPKVHVERWHPEFRGWWPICVPDPNGFGMGWAPTDNAVTCKVCLRSETTWAPLRPKEPQS